ncbi:hypothetical protein WJX82_010021 [Trebouxia sp. C0006]
MEAFLSHYQEHPPAADSRDCDYAGVLADAMRKKQPHIVQQFLGCANLPKELDLGRLVDWEHWESCADWWPPYKALLSYCHGAYPQCLTFSLDKAAEEGSVQLIETLLLHGVGINDDFRKASPVCS